MRRYGELLAIDHEPTIAANVGFTPLIGAEGLAKALGVKELYLNDSFSDVPYKLKLP
jgi:threonine synthase